MEYIVSSVPMTGTIKGREYSYTGMEARCADCCSLVYVPEISDTNLEALLRTRHFMRNWIDELYLEVKSRWNRIRGLQDANLEECAFLVHLIEDIENNTDD